MRSVVFILIMTALLAGCGPKLTPVTATHELQSDASVHEADVARVGESLLAGKEMYVLPVYAPKAVFRVPSTEDDSFITLKPGQHWIAAYRLSDGTMLIEAPRDVSPKDIRLGLRIDENGTVKGYRPWFDLSDKARPSQPYWDQQWRELFVPRSSVPVDVFVFDVRYKGMDGERGVFEHTDFKRVGVKDGDVVIVRLGEQESLRMHGMDIRIVGLYPDHVRYVVEFVGKE